jgi:hypothetical protein
MRKRTNARTFSSCPSGEGNSNNRLRRGRARYGWAWCSLIYSVTHDTRKEFPVKTSGCEKFCPGYFVAAFIAWRSAASFSPDQYLQSS